MADDKDLTPTGGVVRGGSIESPNTTMAEVKATTKEDKTTSNTSKEVKPSSSVKNTVGTFKIQEIAGDKIVIGFYGHRIALPNKNKKLGDSIELEYSGDRQNFKIISYK